MEVTCKISHLKATPFQYVQHSFIKTDLNVTSLYRKIHMHVLVAYKILCWSVWNTRPDTVVVLYFYSFPNLCLLLNVSRPRHESTD